MNVLTDIRMAFRQLAKRPGFALAVVITLALGIGANAAIFSLFHQVILRPLPVPEAERLVNLESPGIRSGSVSAGIAGEPQAVFSYPMFRDLQATEGALAGLAAHREFGANFSFEGVTTSGQGLLVSGSYFPVLNLQPALGRLLDRNDDPAIGERRVAVLGHRFWLNQLGGDPDIVGKMLSVNGERLTVVGVVPAGFRGTTLGQDPDVFVPITIRWLLEPRIEESHADRRDYWVYLFGRLAPGSSIERAREVLNARYQSIVHEIEAPLQGMGPETLQRFISRPLNLVPGRLGQSTVREQGLAPLALLLTVTGLVLLIACVNVANLLLLRGASRTGELAVRASIGAGRARLVRQLMVESLLLAIAGGAGGILIAGATLHLMARLLPPFATAGLELELSPSVMGVSMLLAIGALLVFGLLPAAHASRVKPAIVLRGQAGQPGGGRAMARFRTGLVLVQITLSMTLLITAGLFIRSLNNLNAADLGMQVESVVTFGVGPARNGYSPERSMQVYRDIEEGLSALPGVLAASSSMVPLLTDSNWRNNVSVEGFEPTPDSDPHASVNEIGPDYFETFRIPLIAGRSFTEADRLGAPRVAIVNRRFVENFGIQDPVPGTRMAIGERDELDIEIVGVVADTRYNNVRDGDPVLYYRPNRQNESIPFMTFYVRSALPADQVMASIRELVAGIDPNLPVDNLATMPSVVADNVFLERFVGVLSAAFASLATVLAAVGLYGVLAYSIAQRTRELGLRMALGAAPATLWQDVVRRVGLLTVIGALVGLAAALAIGRLAGSLLYELEPNDPLVLVAAVVTLAAVALAAGYLPARRAARIHPNEALRYQ